MTEFWHSIAPVIPAGIAPWWYYFCVGSAVLIVGISKAGFGGGVGVLAIPVMALVVGGPHMLGMVLPILIACDIFSNLHHIGHYDWGKLRWLLPGIVIGIAIGTIILWLMSGQRPESFDRTTNGIIGGFCLIVVLMQVIRLLGREIPMFPPHPASATAVGCISGIISTLNNGAGPLVTVYLLQEKLEKRKLVGTLLLYFIIGNTLKLPTYLFLPMADGQTLINASTLHDSVWFIPLIPIGTLMGAWMHHRVPEKPFAAIMYVATGIAALDLLCKAFWLYSMFDSRLWGLLFHSA
ncbi:MAG: sulfite exporter TauE/SafE family protein [Planctomycetes bacterium]|nr:sulfite exporter TauE/SafE family protein [Planctomycetota bacterium]